jgi:hypothetical protein
MALNIPQIVRQFKADVAKALSQETVERICGYLGYVCRQRVLEPTTTLHVFLLQILHGNTALTALSRLAIRGILRRQGNLDALDTGQLPEHAAMPCGGCIRRSSCETAKA